MDEESDFSVEFTESKGYFSRFSTTGRVQGRCGSWCWPRATSGSSMADRGRRTSVKDQRVSNSAEKLFVLRINMNIYIYTSLITCDWMNESWDHPWMHPWMNHVIWIYIDSFWRGLQSFVWLRRLWHVEYTILIFWWWARAPKQLRFAASFQLAALAVLDESHLQNAVGEFPKNIQFCHSFWPRCPWNGVWNSGPRKAIMVTRANLIEVSLIHCFLL